MRLALMSSSRRWALQPEMREMAKEELNDSKARVEELEQELKILLLPKKYKA